MIFQTKTDGQTLYHTRFTNWVKFRSFVGIEKSCAENSASYASTQLAQFDEPETQLWSRIIEVYARLTSIKDLVIAIRGNPSREFAFN